MPLQAPQWTEVLLCPVCCKDFSASGRQPVSLSCGHTACRMCLSKLHRQQCPFDQTSISKDVDKLPTNYAILQLVAGPDVMKDPSRRRLPDGLKPTEYNNYQTTQGVIEELALYLKVLHKSSPSGVNGTAGSSMGTPLLSRPIQRKLVTLVNCQLIEEEGRARAVRAARSLGERIVTELIIQHQNPQQLSTNLWAAVRGRGCQFLGPAMQEETLKLVLLALEDGTRLSRKVLVMFVVQKLEMQFPQASKTSVGHVVQLLYRASCFEVTKRNEESSLMQLRDEFRNYDSLRREHDTQIVQIAIEAGLRISPEQWSSLLYGDLNHKSHMQSIIDKLQTPASFTSSIQELTICLQRSGDPVRLAQLRAQLEKLAAIDPSPGAMISSWEGIMSAVDAVKKVLKGLMEFLQNHSQIKKPLDIQTQNIKYKTSLCRDVMQKGGCPRGSSCTFAHSEEELEKYRSKSRQLLSSLNNQNKTSMTSSSSSIGDSSLGETRNGLSARSINSSVVSNPELQPKPQPKPDINEVTLSLLREGDLPTFPRSEPPPRLHIGSESRLGGNSQVAIESRNGRDSHLGSESRSGSNLQSRNESSLGSQTGLGSESRLGSSECRYGSAKGIGSAPDNRYGVSILPGSEQQERFSLTDGSKTGSGQVLRTPRSVSSSHIQTEDDLPIDDVIQASLYGLKSRTKQPMGMNKDPVSPAPVDRPPQLGYPKGNPLPSSNAKMYMANRSLSMNAAEPVERMDSERTHSSDGGLGLPRDIGGRRLTADIDRYSVPSDEGYFYERRLPSSESPRPYPSQTPPAPQPRILVPSAPPAQPQADRYERQQDPYPYHAPTADGVGSGREGSGYLYPESPVLHQAPPPDRMQYRRPMVRRFIDPHTMKAYDVVPVDDYVEPSAPPPSLLPSQRYQPPPMYREHPDYYVGYDQRGRRVMEIRNPPPASQTMPQGMVPQGVPSRLVPKESPTKLPEVKGSKLPSHKAAIAPPHNKAPLRVERGPSLTELKERQNYLVNVLDEFQDDTDTRDDEPTWGKSSSIPTSVWSSSNTSIAWSSPSDRRLTNSLWETSSAPISSSSLSFNFCGINDDDDDDDIDHRKNGIDVDADDEIQSVKFDNVDDGADDDRLDSEVESYNPWTSASLFVPNTGKAVKETATNYTMTYSKVLVRHVSTGEDDASQKAPHGSHTMGDFEKMSMNELQRTLKQVEKEDKRAGSSHFERGHKIQIEMGRREEESPTSMPHFASSPSVPLPAQLVSKEPILHMYPKYSQAEALASCHGPVSGSARVLGSNTGPLKVSAGMVENTMPVNMTVQDCQVAPGFQTPEGDGYYIRTPDVPSKEGEAGILQDDWVTNVEKLVECDPQAEEKLKQALNQVRTRIQAKETVKHAHNTFILDFEEKILENMNSEKEHRPAEYSHGSPHASHQDPHQKTPAVPDSRSVQMQETVRARYATRQPDPLSRDQWMQQGGSPSHTPGYQGYHHQPHPMDAYTSPTAPYPRLVPAGAAPGWPGRYGPAGAAGQAPMDAKRHATKRQMEEADLQYAKRMQDKEHEEYLRHLEDCQRKHEKVERLEHQRRMQEARDRDMARDIARKEAMSRGYSGFQ